MMLCLWVLTIDIMMGESGWCLDQQKKVSEFSFGYYFFFLESKRRERICIVLLLSFIPHHCLTETAQSNIKGTVLFTMDDVITKHPKLQIFLMGLQQLRYK